MALVARKSIILHMGTAHSVRYSPEIFEIATNGNINIFDCAMWYKRVAKFKFSGVALDETSVSLRHSVISWFTINLGTDQWKAVRNYKRQCAAGFVSIYSWN